MTFPQIGEQLEFLLLLDDIVFTALDQLGIRQLGKQPIQRYTHILGQLFYCYITHGAPPIALVLLLVREPRSAGRHNQLSCTLFVHALDIHHFIH